MRFSLQDAMKVGALLVALSTNYALTRADVARLAEKVDQVNPIALEMRLGEIKAELGEARVELRLLRESIEQRRR